jgi:hypothetical protein
LEQLSMLAEVSYERVRLVVRGMNVAIKKLHEAGTPLELPVEGSPQFRVTSLVPFSYESYSGQWNGRRGAPHIEGQLALVALLTARRFGGGASVYGALQKDPEAETFGFRINTVQRLDWIAESLEKPALSSLVVRPGLSNPQDSGA